MRRIALILIAVIAVSGLFCGCGRVSASELPSQDQISKIKEEYPGVFGLDTSKGLDIVVWQLAEHDLNFALVRHRDGEYGIVDDELLELTGHKASGLSLDQLKEVLTTYDVSKDDLYVVPWQSSLSSYIPPEVAKDKDGYIRSVRDMLGI